jgi:hypothetical protein
MSAPNIVNVSSIYGKTAVQAVGTSATAILTNSSGSNKVFKVESLYVSNVTNSTNASVTVDLYRSSTAYRVVSQLTVPFYGSLNVFDKTIYLEEGDSIRLTANAGSSIEAVCSYEEIS